MKRHFTLDRPHALLAVILPTLVFAITSIYGIVGLITGTDVAWFGALFGLGLLLFLDHFVALSHPTNVIIDENTLQFRAFWWHHTYTIENITRINVRPVSRGLRMYVRLNDAGLLKGRYWLHLDHMSDAKELKDFLENLMNERHPKFKNMDRHSYKRVK